MILIKNSIGYSINNENEHAILNGRVFFENNVMTINLLAYSKNGNYIGACSYNYINISDCTKVISRVPKSYISIIEKMLDEIVEFLIEKFNIK